MEPLAGRLVLVVGPSGAGKDSIIRGASTVFAGDRNIVFPRRVITRKPDAAAEDHDSMSDIAFADAAAAGDFAVWWTAHGNRYGIPRTIDTSLAAGQTVVFNCSRDAIADVLARYPNVIIADIQVSPAVLVERITRRGRETRQEAEQRVARKVALYPAQADVRVIRNDGELERAIAAFCELLKASDYA